MSIRDGIERICGRGLDARALRVALLGEIRETVPFSAYAWVLTDPDTCVGSDPLAEVPSPVDLPALIRLKYLTPTNRWTTLRPSRPSTLVDATGGDLSASRVWGELLAGYGVTDVASMVFRDPHGCWGFLDLWRVAGRFSPRECQLLGEFADSVSPALRRSLAPTFGLTPEEIHHDGPAVLMLSEGIEIVSQTPQTDAYLRSLLPTEQSRSPVPAAAYNVAAQLLAHESGVDAGTPSARVHLRDGIWVTLRAARILGRGPYAASIAVSIERSTSAERMDLYSRVFGLSGRETELLEHLVSGDSTRELARRLFVSENTVQDHLKSIFAKTGVNSRSRLIARATGVATAPRAT